MIRSSFRTSLFAAAIAFTTAFGTVSTAHAGNLQDEVDKALAAGAMKAAQSSALKKILKAARKLPGLNVTNVKESGGAITGDVKFLNINWNFLAYSGGGAQSTFIAFGPKRIFKFKDIFKKAPGIELLDTIKFDNQLLAFAAGDVEVEAKDLPANARAVTDKLFGDSDYTLAVPQGLTNFASFNLGNAKPLNDAIKFLGGKSSKVYTTVSIIGNVLDNLLEGKPPAPEIVMRADLPKFRPSIGNKIKLPADMQFSLLATLSLQGRKAKDSPTKRPIVKGVTMGFEGETDFKIGKQKVNMVLETAITQGTGAPEVSVTASTFKGIPWKKAFGIPWMTIEDYRMTFGGQGGTVDLGFGGKTTIGGKTFDVFASGQVGAETAGFPIPQEVRLALDEGPNKIASLGIKDIASIFVEMGKAIGKNKGLKLPKDFPDIAIAGTKKGEGPYIAIKLEASGSAGIDMGGALRVLGTNLATVDRAFIQADEGIEIRAKTAKLGVGPIKFPQGDVELVARASAGDREFPLPKLIIKTRGLELFGSKSEFELVMQLNQFKLAALQNFGSLFKFNFLASTGEPIVSLEHLAKADFRLDASLSSDPGKWLRTSGKKAVQTAFAQVRKDVDAATKDITTAQKKVKKLDGDITRMKAKVRKERQKPAKQLKAAEDDVKKLDRDIGNMNNKIKGAKSRIHSCNQSKRICVWGKPVKDGCEKKILGKCIIPKMKWKCQKHKNVADLPARAVCQAKNVKPAAELASFETAKASLVASREVASKTLEGIRKGLTSIPVELDPRVSSLIAARETAVGVLEAAKQTVKGFGEFTKILTQGVNIVGKPDLFALEKSSLNGSMRGAIQGKPVVLAMNFRLLGKRFGERFAFSLTDMKFNADQLTVIALGAATQEVMKIGRKAKVIPHALLDKVNDIYTKKRAAVNSALDKAIGKNNVGTSETRKLASLGDTIEKGNEGRKAKRRAARKARQLAKRKARKARKLKKLEALRVAKGRSDHIFMVKPRGELVMYTRNRLVETLYGWRQQSVKIGSGWRKQFKNKIFLGNPGEFYGIQPNGYLLYYGFNFKRNKWALTEKKIGTGWNQFRQVFGGGKGVIYAIRKNGDLLAYRHDGRFNWKVASKKFGTGWNQFSKVFYGGFGVIYAIRKNGDLLAYRHDQNYKWRLTSKKFGSGWNQFTSVFSTGGGRIYATRRDGKLYFFRHDGKFKWPVVNKVVGNAGWGQGGQLVLGALEDK
ncbi:MAG: hypothetical protein GKS01_13510 [Alphaproteobacteria bacterium]|nr:hypothetical protein [Alphaproteobacteria bacterium]